MVIPYLRLFCLVSIGLLISANVSADIYKWVDKQGQTHYSQTPPVNQQAEKLVTPPPPTIDPDNAQQEVDRLIQQQKAAEQVQKQRQQEQEQNAAIAAQRKQNCEIAKHNLQLYQDNPGRRMLDAQGNAVRITEEMRQQKIKEMQQQVQQYCQ